MEGNEKTMTTTTTTTTETKSRLGRNKSEANMNKGGEKGSKITITKTEISTENQGGRNGKLQISRSGRNITENSGSTTEKKVTKVRESSKGGNKVETVTTRKQKLLSVHKEIILEEVEVELNKKLQVLQLQQLQKL